MLKSKDDKEINTGRLYIIHKLHKQKLHLDKRRQYYATKTVHFAHYFLQENEISEPGSILELNLL